MFVRSSVPAHVTAPDDCVSQHMNAAPPVICGTSLVGGVTPGGTQPQHVAPPVLPPVAPMTHVAPAKADTTVDAPLRSRPPPTDSHICVTPAPAGVEDDGLGGTAADGDDDAVYDGDGVVDAGRTRAKGMFSTLRAGGV